MTSGHVSSSLSTRPSKNALLHLPRLMATCKSAELHGAQQTRMRREVQVLPDPAYLPLTSGNAAVVPCNQPPRTHRWSARSAAPPLLLSAQGPPDQGVRRCLRALLD